MAVPILNIEVLKYFQPVISFLFIFVILFAILEKSKILGEERTNLNALLSFLIALILILTPGALGVINFMIGPFVVLFFFILFIVVMFMFMGVSEKTIGEVFSSSVVVSTIIIISVIILIFAFTNVFGPAIQQFTTGDGSLEEGGEAGASSLGITIGRILFNPKILGVAFLLLVASQAIRLLAGAKK